MAQGSEIRPQTNAQPFARFRIRMFSWRRKGSASRRSKEENVRNLIKAGVVILTMGLWLTPNPLAAQGRGVGGPGGAPGVSGAHAPLGAPGGDAGSLGAGHSGGSSRNAGNANTTDSGKKTPDQLLGQNAKLSDNLSNLLTKMGVTATPQQACQNFKNLGQCVAAIHVANNLGIDFNKLACDMTLKPATASTCPTGTATGAKGISLGASIDALKPGANGKTESHKAVTEANQDMKGSGS